MDSLEPVLSKTGDLGDFPARYKLLNFIGKNLRATLKVGYSDGGGYQGVPVGTIKRYATGKGNADKAAMVAAMRARGFAPVDDNEADALALLLWATDAEGGRA
jgi:Holliday junction resolvasome RuvABC endonuclease subunit